MFTPHAREIAILGVSHTQFVSAPWKGGGKHERLVFAKQVFLETGKTENNETQRTMPVTVGSGSATGRPTSTDVNGHSSLSVVFCFVVLGFSIVFFRLCVSGFRFVRLPWILAKGKNSHCAGRGALSTMRSVGLVLSV